MKKLITIITLIFSSTLFAMNNGQILVDISGIDKVEGQLGIGLFNQETDFPQVDKAYQGVFLTLTEKNAQYTFSNLPYGEYAIAVFHDSNNNGKLDKNLLGIPKEGYGFSNNATATFGSPHFNEAKFKLEGEHHIEIKIKY